MSRGRPQQQDNGAFLPPINQSIQDQLIYLDRGVPQMDQSRVIQSLDDQMKVIASVCKKLNGDIEQLDNQLNEKTFLLNNIEFKTNDLQSSNITTNKDLQFKLARHDTLLSKLESDQLNTHGQVRDMENQLQESNRITNVRLSEIERRIQELNGKFDSVMMEQTLVLKNVEGDTIKQLQLVDGKTRTMLDDLRQQLNQARANHDADLNRLESRLTGKLDDNQRANEKFDRIERKLDDYQDSMGSRFGTFESDITKNITKLESTTEKINDKVNRGLEDRLSKLSLDTDRGRKDLKKGFETIQASIVSLQSLVDGKIKLSEDKLEQEMDKIRKMVVLM